MVIAKREKHLEASPRLEIRATVETVNVKFNRAGNLTPWSFEFNHRVAAVPSNQRRSTRVNERVSSRGRGLYGQLYMDRYTQGPKDIGIRLTDCLRRFPLNGLSGASISWACSIFHSSLFPFLFLQISTTARFTPLANLPASFSSLMGRSLIHIISIGEIVNLDSQQFV